MSRERCGLHYCLCAEHVRKTVARATWSRLCTAADGQFILTVGNHFIALRKKDGCLEVNHGHRSHEWQSACRWQTGVPIGFSEDLGQWLIDPAACSGLFCIEERVRLDNPKPKH